MPLARLPNRSEDSVSAASAGLGEQHISSVVLALPPSESCMYKSFDVTPPTISDLQDQSMSKTLQNLSMACLEHTREFGVAVRDVRAAMVCESADDVAQGAEGLVYHLALVHGEAIGASPVLPFRTWANCQDVSEVLGVSSRMALSSHDIT